MSVINSFESRETFKAFGSHNHYPSMIHLVRNISNALTKSIDSCKCTDYDNFCSRQPVFNPSANRYHAFSGFVLSGTI